MAIIIIIIIYFIFFFWGGGWKLSVEISVADNFQSQGVNEKFWGVDRCGSIQIFLSFSS